MKYLEERSIVHRDLAARNVLGESIALISYLFHVAYTVYAVEKAKTVMYVLGLASKR